MDLKVPEVPCICLHDIFQIYFCLTGLPLLQSPTHSNPTGWTNSTGMSDMYRYVRYVSIYTDMYQYLLLCIDIYRRRGIQQRPEFYHFENRFDLGASWSRFKALKIKKFFCGNFLKQTGT